MTIYLYTCRLMCSVNEMPKHSHAFMIVLKCYGNWTVRYMCTLKFTCSYSCLFPCFVDNMLTYVLALMITCSHVYLLWWSHAHMPVCPHACMPSCSYVWMFWWLYAHMLVCSHVLTCLVGHMSTCFDDHVCSHADMLGYLQLIVEMLGCSLV